MPKKFIVNHPLCVTDCTKWPEEMEISGGKSNIVNTDFNTTTTAPSVDNIVPNVYIVVVS